MPGPHSLALNSWGAGSDRRPSSGAAGGWTGCGPRERDGPLRLLLAAALSLDDALSAGLLFFFPRRFRSDRSGHTADRKALSEAARRSVTSE